MMEAGCPSETIVFPVRLYGVTTQKIILVMVNFIPLILAIPEKSHCCFPRSSISEAC
jgi:hypothetical protein